MQSVTCSDSYVIFRLCDYLFVNVYLPFVGSADRQLLCENILEEIWSWHQQYPDNEVIIAGDFNADLDSSDTVGHYISSFLSSCSLTRCDQLFPDAKTPTYVNIKIGHSRGTKC